MNTCCQSRHWYPKADPQREPSPWWYFGRAVYVSRRDYKKIFLAFLGIGIPMGIIGLWVPALMRAAWITAGFGLVLLIYSLFGLYRMYGKPSVRYFKQLLSLAGIQQNITLADLHIGTYRHAYSIAKLLPEACIYTVDCWDVKGPSPEEAVGDVRALEPPPASHPRIQAFHAEDYQLPLPDSSCDVVLFGFGTHEIPRGGPREKLFREARRILKDHGTVLLFEHGYDFHNYLIFGPVINHVTHREDWKKIMEEYFQDVQYARSSQAVDLFVGRKYANQ